MDGLSLQMPVTLVVKAPNQKIQDLTVECGLEWTIRKLKEHLSNVYPSKPTRNQQKLIYSGKLLLDHQMLKDVLRQYDQNQTTHTVHLVCAHMASEMHNEMKQTTVPSNSTAQENSEGLRHRHPPQTHTSHPEPLPQPSVPQSVPATQQLPMAPMDYNAMQQMFGFGANPMMYGGFPGMMAMTPEQMAWMQQVYTQQMNYFLQMYQGPVPTPPATPTNIMNHQQPAVPPQPEVAQPEVGPVDQPIRMNAQGGGMDDEDGEEGRRRDWLDWLYTFSRFSVLLSIVYFYSTPSRFILVITFFLFFYLFQGGWFNLNRNAADRRQQPAQEAAQEAQQLQQPQPNPEPTPVDQSAEEGSGEEAASSEDDAPLGDAAEPVVPPLPPQPSGIEVAWNFFTSFFSSLVPQQPPAVNAN